MSDLAPRRIIAFLPPHLGDAVHHTITTRWIREAWPGAHFVAVTGTLGEPVLRTCPWIDEVWHRSSNKYGLFGRILKGRFDLALFPYVHNPYVRMAILARIPVKIGVRGGKFDRFLTHSIDFVPTENSVCDSMEQLLRLVGKPVSDHEPFVGISPEAALEADRALGPGRKRLVGLMVGASNAHKEWSRENFVELAKRFISDGFDVVSVGGPTERGALPGAIDLAGTCSVLGTAEVLRRCAVVVTNDTGVAHVATAVRTPTVVIYGPSRIMMPPGGRSTLLRRDCACAGFVLADCPGDCLRGHSVEKVFTAALDALKSAPLPRI